MPLCEDPKLAPWRYPRFGRLERATSGLRVQVGLLLFVGLLSGFVRLHFEVHCGSLCS